MLYVRYRAPYLSIDAFSHFRADDIFAAARGPYRIQHSVDKPSHQKRLLVKAPKHHLHVYPVLHSALYSTLESTALPQHV